MHQIKKKNIHLVCNISFSTDQRFYSDPEKIYLILSNLFSNAIQFTDNNGSVEIGADIEEGTLRLFIKDSGVGIPADSQSTIFNRFRQLDEGSTKKYGGHGLGLSITKALLEQINGTIDLHSEMEKGTTFSICIREEEKSQGENDIASADGNDFLFHSANELLF
jgi:signal transduction histidine kinase